MTVKISPHKISKILRYYFRGEAQIDIARKVRVDQSTVSLYSHLFMERTKRYGLEAVGREFDVYDEVIALRSLAVELHEVKLTTEDARQGTKIIHKFIKLGVETDRHIDLIKVCKEIDNLEFVHYAIRFMEIEHGSNLSYEETIQRFQKTAMSLPTVETKIQKMQEKIKSLNELMARKQQLLSNIESKSIQLQKETNSKKDRLQKEIQEEIRRLGVMSNEINEVRDLKSMLKKQNLDIPTLVRLAKEFQK